MNNLAIDEVILALYSGKYALNGTQFQIILCIIYNINYNLKKGEELSLKNLSMETGKCRDQIQRELSRLIERKIVRVVENYSSEFCTGRILTINNPSEWIKKEK